MIERWTSDSLQQEETIYNFITSVTWEMCNWQTRNVLRQSHLIKLVILSIILIWQELSLIQVWTSYHKGLFMLIASLLLQFLNNKVRNLQKFDITDHVVIFFICLFFVFDFWLVYYAITWLNALFPNISLNSWKIMWYSRKKSKKLFWNCCFGMLFTDNKSITANK